MSGPADRRGIDREEAQSTLLLVGSARDAAAERAMFVAAVITELGRISSNVHDGADGENLAADEWAGLFDELDAATTDLLTLQACYQAAARAIAEPLAASLAAFLS